MEEKKRQGSLFGAALLVAGSCIGAGMLGLPILTGEAGFMPALVMFTFAWLFMISSGLLLLEVNLNYGSGASIDTLVKKTLGETARIIAWIIYLFLFYALMVAVIAGAGPILGDIIEEILPVRLPSWLYIVTVGAFFALLTYRGTESVDFWNRVFMVGLVIGYLFLVTFGIGKVKPALLQHSNWKAAVLVLPVMIASFGFQNLIPTLTSYLDCNAVKLKKSIIFGSMGALVLYIFWEWIVLGLLPLEGPGGIIESRMEGSSASHALKKVIDSTQLILASELFAFSAIVTTLLGVGLSFVDFLADGLSIPKGGKGSAVLCTIVYLPPIAIALLYPHIFLNALGYAGGFGAVILFGLFPAIMAWICRYRKYNSLYEMLPGGKIVILLIMLVSIGIIFLEVLYVLGYRL